MRNLWIFINKYNAFFLFVIFELSGLYIFINYNSFQKATYISSSADLTALAFEKRNQVTNYLALSETNDSLVLENARLRSQLRSSFYVDTLTKRKVTDSVYKQQYSYTVAKVINNSTNKRSNYITIDKGSKDGIAKDMGVICGSGVVGVVVNVTEHFADVRSVLHKNTKISAMLADTHDYGNFLWGDNLDPHKGILIDISNNVRPHLGEAVVTSTHTSLFPVGIPIGKITNLQAKDKNDGLFLNLEVALAVDYSKLEYVYVVNNLRALEQKTLEAARPIDKDE